MYKTCLHEVSLLSRSGAHALEDLYVIILEQHGTSTVTWLKGGCHPMPGAPSWRLLFEDAISLVSMHGYPYASFTSLWFARKSVVAD
jgi:hypothetical protein